MVFKSKAALKSEEPTQTEESENANSARPRRASKSPARPKSPSRTNKSPSRTRSPGRTKTPKSPARKSPSRTKIELTPPPLQSSTPKVAVPKARSPIRRSPGRKSPTRVTKTVQKSAETYFTEKVQRPSRRTRLDVDTDSDTPDGDVGLDKPRAAVKGRTRQLEVQVEKMNISAEPVNFNVVRRVTQSSQTRDVERVVHLKHFDNLAQKLGEFSDEDESLQVRKSASVERFSEFKQITEFGGTWGALFYTLVTPLSVMAILIACSKRQCSFFKLPPYENYLHLSAYFDLMSILGFVGYAVVLAVLSVIPFGGKQVSGMATKQGKFTYTMNGLFSCFILTAIAVGLELKKIPISEFIVNHLFHLLIASILFGFILTVHAYVRSFYVPFSSLNAHVVGRNRIYGFFMGRELNPRLFSLLDLKMYVFRLALIGSFLLDLAFLSHNLGWATTKTAGVSDLKSLNINSTLFVLVLIHSIYYGDALAHETAFVTSFEIQYEGFGYMAGVGYLVYPFMMAAVTRYVVDYNIQLSLWKLVLTTFVFCLGYVLFRLSNNQKDAFRKNPYDPALSHLETIPTTKGKKLLCSGFWGVVRHPNYLGDILMNFSFIPFAFDVPPVVSAISIILLLIHRSIRDHVRCKQKYGAAWDRYCNKVKYVLVPKIY